MVFPKYLNVPLKHRGSLHERKHVNKEVRVWPWGETNRDNKWLFRAELTTFLFVARPFLTENRQKRRVEHFTELDSATLLWISSAVRFFQIAAFMKRDVWGQQVPYDRQWRIDGVLCTTRFPPLEEKFCYQMNIFIQSIFIDGHLSGYLSLVSARYLSIRRNVKDNRCRYRWIWWSSRKIWRSYFNESCFLLW